MNEDLERFAMGGARAIAARDWEAYGELFAEDLVMRTPSLPGVSKGREARVRLVRELIEAFPDGTVELEGAFAEGNQACLQVMFEGTHTQPLAGDGGAVPATNRKVRFPYCIVMSFEDGVVTHLDEYYDQQSFLTQLGIVS